MSTSPYVCCANSCLIFSDGFNRNGPGLGCQWEVRQGSWSIDNQRLKESGNAGALVVARRAAPELSFYVSVYTASVPNNAIYRIIVNYVDDDNYQFAEFAFTSQQLTLRLYKRTGGNNGTPLVERSWDVNLTGIEQSFGVYLSEKIFLATQQYAPYQVWVTDPALLEDGYQAGLGNGGQVQIEYGSFALYETGDTNPDCWKCGCRCDDIPLPMQLTAECSFLGGLAACDPVSVTLTALDPDSPKFGTVTDWYGTATVECPDCNSPLSSFTLYVVFQCNEVWARGAGSDFDTEGSASGPSEDVICNPLSMPFEIVNWLGCGGWCIGESGWSTNLRVEITL